MDYSSLGSGISESLDFLTPPVKRGYGKIGRDTTFGKNLYGHPNNGPFLKDCRSTVTTRHTQFPLCERTGVPSSTSLFLKKTSERQILEQYSVYSYTNLPQPDKRKKCVSTLQNQVTKDRPLIRVSVFPNNTGTQTKSRKRRHAKRIQNTSSNQENSIKANNVYLVVAGRKREKIYEIKTTESAEHKKNQTFHYKDENIPVEKNFKQLITSLNMETVKRRKKGKRKEIIDEAVINPGYSPVNSNTLIRNSFEGASMMNDCNCPFSDKFGNNVRQNKSRVRVVGKIGLTEDDKYVLKCAATLDGEPVEPNYSRGHHQFSMDREQRDSTVQVDMEYFDNRATTNKYRSIETQCTPANFESVCFSNVDKLKIFTQKDEVYRCCCERNSIVNNSTDINYMSNDYITANANPSPLVIISVYPKQNSKENNEKNVEKKSSPHRPNAKPRTEPDSIKNDTKRSRSRSPVCKDNKASRSRSPSPAKSPSKNTRTETGKQRKNRESPDRSNQATLNKKQQKDKPYQDKGSKSSKINPQTKLSSNKKHQSPKGQKSPTQQSTNEQSNVYYNTNSMLAKKALVDAYTKKITAEMNSKRPMQWIGAKNNVSNIAININSENEFYDVLLRQGALVTDLTVRKTMKENDSGASDDDNHSDNPASASLENFLLQDKQRRRSFSQTFLLNEQTVEALNKPVPGINVRDSIEISHRREYNSDHDQSNKSISTSTNNEDNLLFLAPIKHYKGDSCNLPNPIERDKEIRELLGIDKGRPGPSRTTEEHGTANSDQSLHCVYYTRCHNDLLSGEEASLCNIFKEKDQIKAVPSSCECNEELKGVQKEESDDSRELITENQKESDQSDSTPPKEQKMKQKTKSPSQAPPKRSKQSTGSRKKLEQQNFNKHKPTTTDGKEFSKGASKYETFTEKGPLYQQLILNRNINVYLQIEKFTKQKPIVLSQKQYAKVKKTIQSASKKSKKCVCKKTSSISIGEVRRKTDKTSRPKRIEPPPRENNQKKKQTSQSPETNSSDEEQDRRNKRSKKKSKGIECHCYDDENKKDTKQKQNTSKKCPGNCRPDCAGRCKAGLDLENTKKYNNKQNVQRKSKECPGNCPGLCLEYFNEENTREDKNQIEKKSKHHVISENEKKEERIQDAQPSFKIEKLPSGKKSIPLSEDEEESSSGSEATPEYRCCEMCGQLIPTRCDFCGKAVVKPCSNCGLKPNVVQYSIGCYCTNETRNKSVFADFKRNNTTIPSQYQKAIATSRKATSSTEIHFTSVAYMKHVTFSSTNVKIPALGPISKLANNCYNSDSLHTIFKGHRKSATPNLGTSEFSLYSDNSEQSHKLLPDHQELKPRKPFLRRLISCLVMRSQTSDIKVGRPQPNLPTVNSSIDSYHISTSLGAIELSSSIYDTSASFYSNHTIMPVNSKMKRSFLSSVRGFLTNRRS